MCIRPNRRFLGLVLLIAGALTLGCGGAGGGNSQTGGNTESGNGGKVDLSALEEAENYMGQAGLAISEGDHQAAAQYYLQAATVYDRIGGTTIERAEAHFLAAAESYKIGNPGQAIEQYQTAVDIYLQFTGNSKIKAAVGLNNMGSIYKEMEQIDKARNCWSNALQIYKEAPPELQSHGNMATIEQNLRDLQEGF